MLFRFRKVSLWLPTTRGQPWKAARLSSSSGTRENAALNTEAIRDILTKATATPGNVATRRGEGEAALATSAKLIEAIYEAPYLAHAPMEPFTCVADVKSNLCEVWVGSQLPS